MDKKILPFFLFLLIFFSCKKENDNPQWDIDVIGPLFFASLTPANVIGDAHLIEDGNHRLTFDFDTTLSNIELDSIYQITDTTISTVVLFPAFPQTIPPDFPFVSNNNNIVLNAANVQLKNAIISSGRIRLEIKNTLSSKILFTYSIPGATKDGIPFTVHATVDSASLSDPKYFSNEYDFNGYTVDLTGVSGNSFNTIAYNVVARSNPSGVPFLINGNDTVINLKSTLLDITPYYVKGYLGQADITETNNRNIGIGGLIKNGIILLDSVKLQLDLINYIGADAQAYISNFISVNDRTGVQVPLTAPSLINSTININRAVESGDVNDPVNPSVRSFLLDNSNSNLKQFIENIPDGVNYDLRLKLNPGGNLSGSNDFIYSDRLVDTRLHFTMPIRFAASQLLLADTVPFSIDNNETFDPVGPATLTLIVDNGFPIGFHVQMFLLGDDNTIVDSLFSPDIIAPAPVEFTNYTATGISQTRIAILVDATRKANLLGVKRVGLRLLFNTPDYPQFIQIYSHYRLKLKLVADGIYSIR
jgi:hypothetical protein